MEDSIRRVVEADRRIAFALLFGSQVGAAAHTHSDVDVAIGVSEGRTLTALEIGSLTAKLETAVGRSVDVVIVNEAPPGLAYRVFRDGRIVFVRDAQALKQCRVQAILDYLDFQPLEEQFARSILANRHAR